MQLRRQSEEAEISESEIANGDPAQLHVSCPSCGGAVSYVENNGSWRWQRHATGLVDSEVAEAGVPHCRPCLFVACRHHLYADVNLRTGSIKLNFPDRDPDQLELSCALDVAEDGGVPLRVVARAMNLTPERVRQIEERAIEHLMRVRDDG